MIPKRISKCSNEKSLNESQSICFSTSFVSASSGTRLPCQDTHPRVLRLALSCLGVWRSARAAPPQKCCLFLCDSLVIIAVAKKLLLYKLNRLCFAENIRQTSSHARLRHFCSTFLYSMPNLGKSVHTSLSDASPAAMYKSHRFLSFSMMQRPQLFVRMPCPPSSVSYMPFLRRSPTSPGSA